MRIFTVIIAFGLLIQSCSSFKKEVKEVDSLIKILNGTKELILSVDTAEVFPLKREVKKNLQNLQAYKDTLDRESAFLMSDYHSYRKTLYFISDNYYRFIAEVELSEKQLNDLKKDMNNGAITKENFVKYFEAEQAIIVDLNTKISKAVNGLEIIIREIKKIQPQVDEIMATVEGKEEKEE